MNSARGKITFFEKKLSANTVDRHYIALAACRTNPTKRFTVTTTASPKRSDAGNHIQTSAPIAGVPQRELL